MAQTMRLVLFGPVVVVQTLVMVVVGGCDAVVDACGCGRVEMVVVVVLLLPLLLLLLPSDSTRNGWNLVGIWSE